MKILIIAGIILFLIVTYIAIKENVKAYLEIMKEDDCGVNKKHN